jgi:CheY-like chemotaxis protein
VRNDKDALHFNADPAEISAPQSTAPSHRSAAVALHEWQEEERLGRFFAKLIGEVTFLNADRVDFKLDQDSVRGSIVKESRDLKNISVKPVWLPLMRNWLARRENPTFRSKENSSPKGIVCSLRVGGFFVSFVLFVEAKRNVVHSLSLTEFVQQSVDQFYDQLLGDAQSRVYLERLFAGDDGTIVVCAPHGEERARKIGLILTASGAGFLGDLGDPGTREVLSKVAAQQRVVVSISADDPTEGALQLGVHGIDATSIHLKGCVACAGIKAVCGACARKAPIDPSVKASVPEYLQKLSLERYAVGRGCDHCGNQGYDGTIAVFSVLVATPVLFRAEKELQQADLVRHYAHQGLRPLFEEAYRRATEGKTTIEAVLRAVKPPPQAYAAFWKEKNLREPPKVVGSQDQPATTEPAESSLLFPKPPSPPKPKREKPLVLVVEDDDDQRAILELVLKGAEYDVQQARNGVEALEAVGATTPDIMMDGSQMVTCLKRDAATSQVPILMLTMIDDEEREYALLNLGADDYCAKTIQRKVLLKRVENLLRRSQGARS